MFEFLSVESLILPRIDGFAVQPFLHYRAVVVAIPAFTILPSPFNTDSTLYQARGLSRRQTADMNVICLLLCFPEVILHLLFKP